MTVELIDHMGDDLAFVNAARVSFHKESDYDTQGFDWGKLYQEDPGLYAYLAATGDPAKKKKALSLFGLRGTLNEADKGLINFMVRERHGSPFEHAVFKFRVRTPIKVAREWFRHRMASYNEESTRYVKMRGDFYIPDTGNVRSQVGKPGAYTYEAADAELANRYIAAVEYKHGNDWNFYEYWLEQGIARELVSFELPMALLTEFITTVNFRSLTNFLSLREAPNALLEIREEAKQIHKLIRPYVPVALEAFEKAGSLPI